MNPDRQEQLLLKYLSGQLSEEEQQDWNQLQASPQTAAPQEDVAFFADLLMAAELEGEYQLKSDLQNLEVEIQSAKSEPSNFSPKQILDKVNQLINLTVEELTTLFAPVPNYEMALVQANRSDSLQLIFPENHANIEGNILQFSFAKATTESLQLKIENNQQQVLLTTSIPPNTTNFDLSLEGSEFHAGRFYWKLKSKEGTRLGVFFIRKDLQP